MTPDRGPSLSRLSREHLKTLGREAFIRLEEILNSDGGLAFTPNGITFSNGCDKLMAQRPCQDSEKKRKITVCVTRSERRLLGFTLKENGAAEHLFLPPPQLVIEGEKIPLIGSLHIGSNEILSLSVGGKNEIDAIRLGIQLVEKINRSISDMEFKPLNWKLNSDDLS